MADLTIIDIDGCISDDRWRRKHIDNTQLGWNNYHALAKLDSPINLDVVLPHMQAGWAVCTGRPDRWRDDFVRWVQRNSLPLTPHILMRPTDDRRDSVELKREMLSKLRFFGHNIIHAFDDRLDICEMYVKEGIPHVHRLTAKRKHRELPIRVS